MWSGCHAEYRAGYRASIIDYANKIEELLAKMEGIRVEVLPPNRRSVDNYLQCVWQIVHTLTAAVTPLPPDPGLSGVDKFKSYLEAEEARLSTNLKAVAYTIDDTDTLTLITGVGRIEKVSATQHIDRPACLNCVMQTVFPLIYLLLKRHYEIMRAMRTKVLDPDELEDSADTILYVKEAIIYRVNDLTSSFSLYHLAASRRSLHRHIQFAKKQSRKALRVLRLWHR